MCFSLDARIHGRRWEFGPHLFIRTLMEKARRPTGRRTIINIDVPEVATNRVGVIHGADEAQLTATRAHEDI